MPLCSAPPSKFSGLTYLCSQRVRPGHADRTKLIYLATQPIPRFTPDQYLETEREACVRSEYIDGEMFSMGGATVNHARVIRNLSRHLDEQLAELKCETLSNETRVFSASYRAFMYPDIVVVCGSVPYHDDERRDTITDAAAIIEVLSPSTRNYDRGEKFLFYRALPSFSEYLLIAQDRIFAEHHVRQPDGAWMLREYSAAADELEMRTIECKLTLGRAYHRVRF